MTSLRFQMSQTRCRSATKIEPTHFCRQHLSDGLLLLLEVSSFQSPPLSVDSSIQFLISSYVYYCYSGRGRIPVHTPRQFLRVLLLFASRQTPIPKRITVILVGAEFPSTLPTNSYAYYYYSGRGRIPVNSPTNSYAYYCYSRKGRIPVHSPTNSYAYYCFSRMARIPVHTSYRYYYCSGRPEFSSTRRSFG